MKNNRKSKPIKFATSTEVPRENVEVFLYEDDPEFLKRRRQVSTVSLYGPFKRTA